MSIYSIGGHASTYQNMHKTEFQHLLVTIRNKVNNSYNVVGSNWVLGCVVNFNATLTYNFNEIASLDNLVF